VPAESTEHGYKVQTFGGFKEENNCISNFPGLLPVGDTDAAEQHVRDMI
jgi:hypothetical protein